MLQQTDERYVPWSHDLCTGYEHIHRYLLAQQHVKGLKVLDLACGEGYGSWFLSQTASNVVGLDISLDAITHAKTKYTQSNLHFCVGSILDIPESIHDHYDVIICFEALEHVAEQAQLLQQIQKNLKPNGLLMISTPNKPVYSENGTRQNPYHFKELDFFEFEQLMKTHFKHLMFYGQKTYAASKIFPITVGSEGCEEQRINLEDEEWRVSMHEDAYPRYFICMASNGSLSCSKKKSYVVDVSNRQGYIEWVSTQPKDTKPQCAPGWRSKCFKFIRLNILKKINPLRLNMFT